MNKPPDPSLHPHQHQNSVVNSSKARVGGTAEDKGPTTYRSSQQSSSNEDPPSRRIEGVVGSNYRPSLQSSSNEEPPSRRAEARELSTSDAHVILRVVCEAGSSILEPTHVYATTLAKVRFRPSIAERISLTCWELFSNALSYGSVRYPVVLELCDQKSFVELRVTNDSIGARCQLLEQRIAQLKQDAKGTYLEEMRRSVTGGLPRATLGLARVAHEGKMDLSCTVVQTRVLVVARCSIV